MPRHAPLYLQPKTPQVRIPTLWDIHTKST